MKTTKQDRINAFKSIAEAKGYTFEYVGELQNERPSCNQPFDHEIRKIHYDLLMVDQSIRDAIAVIDESLVEATDEIKNRRNHLRGKLSRLLESGSAYEKATFVFSSDSYYFPEDIEAMANNASSSDKKTSADTLFSCEQVCYVVCRCVYTHQECRDMCRWVCS
jgi:hypothetical protein